MAKAKTVHRVLVVSGGKQAYESITDLLPPEEYAAVVHVTSAGEAKRLLLSSDFDVMVINTPLPDEFGTDLAYDFSTGTLGILLLCKSDIYDQVSYQLEDSGIMILPKPVSRQFLYCAVKSLAAFSAKLAKMEKTNRTLQEKMADIRLINRAKWLLIENLGMKESDAHYYIEKQAMDTRLSRREVAEHIIRTYDK